MKLSKKMSDALNEQLVMEANAGQLYLASASWLETQKGLDGFTKFFYKQSDEEREHMLKIIHFINDREGHAIVPSLKEPKNNFKHIKDVFESFVKNERDVTESISKLVDLALTEKDYLTFEFLQWFLKEQFEEERMAITMSEKIKLIGDNTAGLYEFDKDTMKIRKQTSEAAKTEIAGE
jgi:ferritin